MSQKTLPSRPGKRPQPHVAVAHPSRLLSIVETAQALGISRATVFEIMKQGRLAYVRIGGRRLIATGEIDRFIAANEVRSVA